MDDWAIPPPPPFCKMRIPRRKSAFHSDPNPKTPYPPPHCATEVWTRLKVLLSSGGWQFHRRPIDAGSNSGMVKIFRFFWGGGVKRLTLGVFLAQKIDIWPLKSKFLVKIWPSERVILTIFRVAKTRFLEFLKVGLELFRSCLGIVFGLIRSTFRGIFCSKGRYMIPKIKFLCQNLALWEGHFDHFQGQKKSFVLTFWKLFWRCSEVV